MTAAHQTLSANHVALCAARPLPANAEQSSAPEFVHLLPAGMIHTRDGRGPYKLADAAKVVAASMADGASLPIDENHATDVAAPKGAPSPARGWITELQARADGVWGRVEWTDEGRALVAGRAYRHLSPAIQVDSNGRVERVLRASLVNLPNLQRLTALNSAQRTAQTEPAMDMLKLREALGLADDADEQALLDALRPLFDKMGGAATAPDPTKFVPIEMLQKALAEGNKLRQGISRHMAEEVVEDHIRKGVILPFMREWGVELCTMNAPSYEKFIEGVGPGFTHLLKGHGHHFQGTPPRRTIADDEQAVARNLGITEAELAATRGQ